MLISVFIGSFFLVGAVPLACACPFLICYTMCRRTSEEEKLKLEEEMKQSGRLDSLSRSQEEGDHQGAQGEGEFNKAKAENAEKLIEAQHK